MKYVPKKVDDSVNTGEKEYIKNITSIFITVFGGGFLCMFLIFISLDFIVDRLPIEMERQLQSFLPSASFIKTESVAQKNIEKLLERVKSETSVKDYPFKIIINKNKTPNAFMYAGGIMVIHDSLIKQLGSENELAFVIGHEIGHFYHRHHLKSAGINLAIQTMKFLFVGNVDSSEALVDQTSIITGLIFSRKHELESDDFGIRALNGYYGHVNGVGEFFTRFKDSKVVKIFKSISSTHPSDEKRTRHFEQLIKKESFRTNGKFYPIEPYL
jgi:predicted Zn-dependent protease